MSEERYVLLSTLAADSAALPAAAVTQAKVAFPDRTWDVTRYSAKGTRVFLDNRSLPAGD